MASRPPNIAGFRPSIASVADFRKCLIIVLTRKVLEFSVALARGPPTFVDGPKEGWLHR